MELIFIILIVFGQFTIISAALDGKGFSRLKSILVGFYIFIGINIPVAIDIYLSLKLRNNIPILSLIMTFYQWGICLIGLTAIGHSVYRAIKKEYLPYIMKRN